MSEQSPYDCFDRYIICYNSMLLDEDKKRKIIESVLALHYKCNGVAI